MLGDAATLGDGTDTGKARVIMRNGKHPAVPAQSPVFADYAVGDVEQADAGHHARFLAVDVYKRQSLCSSTVGANSSRSDFAHRTASVSSFAGLRIHFRPPKPQYL